MSLLHGSIKSGAKVSFAGFHDDDNNPLKIKFGMKGTVLKVISENVAIIDWDDVRIPCDQQEYVFGSIKVEERAFDFTREPAQRKSFYIPKF